MKKVLIGFAAFAVAGAAYFGVNAMTSKSDASLFLQNVEAMAQSENTTGNTGPSKTKDCPLIWTGDYTHCECTNPYPCTSTSC